MTRSRPAVTGAARPAAPRAGWARTYAAGAVIAVIVAATAFVAHRNHSFEAREHARAMDSAEAIADRRAPLHELIAGGVVLPAEPSNKYPFLRRRQVRAAGAARTTDAAGAVYEARTLGGPDAPPTDKLLYDAATRAEAEGQFVGFLGDDSGRVVAAIPLATGATDDAAARGYAIAVTRPASGPEPFPWLVLLGLLALGAVIAAAGAQLGGPLESPGLAVGAGLLAIPAFIWGGPIPAAVIAGWAIAIAAADRRGWVARAATEIADKRVAYTFLLPAAIAMLVLVATPFVIGLALGFYDHHHGEWTWVGLENFYQILSGDGRSLSDPLSFWFTLGVTVAWTAVNVALHVSIGVALALMLRQRWLRGKGVFRMLLILPWAIPNYITALIWRGMFQSEYGAVNAILAALGLDKVSWFSSWATAFTANVTTNTWLGFPFMMVVALGALESIPRDMYEAAEVDGASAWQRFRHITLPHLRPSLAPAVVLGAIWTFNMFNVIYLVSAGQPGGGTDILVTDAYRWAFERGERYGLASAYATIIFGILLLWTVFGSRITRSEEKS